MYHNVSWEENAYLRGLGGTVPPDVLRDQLAQLARHGELVSISEGIRRLRARDADRPLFSLWFDDGFSDVQTYATPLLDKLGVTGALSVCSRFVEGSELFWRMKLSYLAQVGGLTHLRPRLRRHGYQTGSSVKDFVMDNFSDVILEVIDETYAALTSETARNDAFRMFETVDGLRTIRRDGWIIANHSAAHYPVGEPAVIGAFAEQFAECEDAYEGWFGEPSVFWVLPFDIDAQRRGEVTETFKRCGGARYLVLVGSRGNRAENARRKILYRVDVPLVDGRGLIQHLEAISE